MKNPKTDPSKIPLPSSLPAAPKVAAIPEDVRDQLREAVASRWDLPGLGAYLEVVAEHLRRPLADVVLCLFLRDTRREPINTPKAAPPKVVRKKRRSSISTRGEGHVRAVMTEEKVKEVRLLAAQGERCTDIAEAYGVSVGCISGIVNRRNWKHVH